MFATGGGDAVVNLWLDSTAADKEEAFREEDERVLRGQTMENAVQDGDFSKAIQIAFDLNRPRKLFGLFSEICRKKYVSLQMEKALCDLGHEQLRFLFEYAREWNTKPKMCHIAQLVLFQVFNSISPSVILEVKGIGEVLEGLIPYTQRHLSRIDRVVRSTYLVDYTLSGMGVVEADVDDTNEDRKGSGEDKERDHVQNNDEALEETSLTKKRRSSKTGNTKSKKQRSRGGTSAPASISVEA
ncbi:unnamed protein product [Linum trigynum]|uniref:U3 small nucleolar RNA-associated protein 13 C-terminal domain-containing protein n=1 Tax=Linum trigynum TaxID=586398 RepID=A0AAV2DM47_9ROSI